MKCTGQAIEKALANAKIGKREKLNAIRRLNNFI